MNNLNTKDFLQREIFGSVQRFYDTLNQADIPVGSLADHSKYRKGTDGHSATFEIRESRKKEKKLLSTITVEIGDDIDGSGNLVVLSFTILNGKHAGEYVYSRTVTLPEKRDLCTPFDCLNVRDIPELKHLLSDFSISIEQGDVNMFRKMSE